MMHERAKVRQQNQRTAWAGVVQSVRHAIDNLLLPRACRRASRDAETAQRGATEKVRQTEARMGLIARLRDRELAHERELVHVLRKALGQSETELQRVRRELETALRENAALKFEQAGQR